MTSAAEPAPAIVPPEEEEQEKARRRFLDSEEFAEVLTNHFRAAAGKAVAEHQAAGLPVHGAVDGELTEIPPPTRTQR